MPRYKLGAGALSKLQPRTKLLVTTRSSPVRHQYCEAHPEIPHACLNRMADQRCSSGVEGLDDILAGGLPRAGFYLVQGDRVPARRRWRFSFFSRDYGEARRSFISRFRKPNRSCSKWRDRTAGRSIKSGSWICQPLKICCGPKRRRRYFIHPKSS